jgi:5'-nucleotidase
MLGTSRISRPLQGVLCLLLASASPYRTPVGGSTTAAQAPESDPAGTAKAVTLSIVGTTDLHGRVFPRDGHGGVALLGGYLRNLRAARVLDGGAVLLLDAGDTFQGGIESNLSEGALVVDAYNALGYDALAIGNHDFEYGALDTASGDGATDMRGALKAAAARAGFPFLAANVIDDSTGFPVDWPNVRPSTLVDTAGLRVGIVGVMTYDGLRQTLAANVQGLRTAPLGPTVETEARQLRERGADVVLVLSHAGGWCDWFGDPSDLSSCGDEAEIFQLARQLPIGLVDGIVAGHTHAGVAHDVAGIPIIQAYQRGIAFARMDLEVVPGSGVVATRIFPPQGVCATVGPDGDCADVGATVAQYEGGPVTPDATVIAAMRPELEGVEQWRADSLGIVLETPLERRADGLESPLGNLFADALLAAVPDAEVAIGLGARRGGLRTGLPAGPLTRGPLYDAFPFDNRVVTLTLTGDELERVLTRAAGRTWSGLPSVSGVRVRVTCAAGGPEIEVLRSSGQPIAPDEPIVVAATDFFGRRLRLGAEVPATELPSAPMVRDAAADWLSARGGRVYAADFRHPPRWEPLDGGACLAAN